MTFPHKALCMIAPARTLQPPRGPSLTCCAVGCGQALVLSLRHETKTRYGTGGSWALTQHRELFHRSLDHLCGPWSPLVAKGAVPSLLRLLWAHPSGALYEETLVSILTGILEAENGNPTEMRPAVWPAVWAPCYRSLSEAGILTPPAEAAGGPVRFASRSARRCIEVPSRLDGHAEPKGGDPGVELASLSRPGP